VFQIDSTIVCGGLVTAIARNLGVLTDDVISHQTQPPIYPARIDQTTARNMKIVRLVDGILHWSADQGATIWAGPEGQQQEQQQGPAGELPPQEPVPHRVLVRPIPPTPDFMHQATDMLRTSTRLLRRATHMLDQSQRIQAWTVTVLRGLADQHGVAYPPVAPAEPYVSGDEDDAPPP
jgi:hypothetical protein